MGLWDNNSKLVYLECFDAVIKIMINEPQPKHPQKRRYSSIMFHDPKTRLVLDKSTLQLIWTTVYGLYLLDFFVFSVVVCVV